MNDINSSFGKGSVTRLGSAGGALVETFPSGCLTLDFALGSGLPRGRIVEIFGPESSGKTTLALHAIAEIQKLGGNAMLVDAEHAFDPTYSRALGVDIENLIVCQPDNGEMALENFMASLRLEIRPIGKIKSAKGDEDIGIRVRVRVQKSKVSRPYKQAEFEIIFGEGVGKLGCLLDCAELMDVIVKKGSWYSYGENSGFIRLGQGKEKALQYLRENPTRSRCVVYHQWMLWTFCVESCILKLYLDVES
ncbi:DNA repair protein recA homolog 1, chloroplastic-like [Curcuma longa]|uniref:DNA repair protein recA homolog 1, chloroplastic-like n=1 Tax=Curcuma longa TaxID=136217 RepID=UPI003D9DCBD2